MSIKAQLWESGIDWDEGDKWGSAMAAWFGCADALYAAGEPVPDTWEYQPGLGAGTLNPDEDYEAIALTNAVAGNDMPHDHTFTWDSVRHIGDVLARYAHACTNAGLSY